jgi:hypothetical protein
LPDLWYLEDAPADSGRTDIDALARHLENDVDQVAHRREQISTRSLLFVGEARLLAAVRASAAGRGVINTRRWCIERCAMLGHEALRCLSYR